MNEHMNTAQVACILYLAPVANDQVPTSFNPYAVGASGYWPLNVENMVHNSSTDNCEHDPSANLGDVQWQSIELEPVFQVLLYV